MPALCLGLSFSQPYSLFKPPTALLKHIIVKYKAWFKARISDKDKSPSQEAAAIALEPNTREVEVGQAHLVNKVSSRKPELLHTETLEKDQKKNVKGDIILKRWIIRSLWASEDQPSSGGMGNLSLSYKWPGSLE